VKLNHANKKREVVEKYLSLCELYHKGERPGCIAAILPDDLRDKLLEDCRLLVAQGYSFSKTSYDFLRDAGTRDIMQGAIERAYFDKHLAAWPNYMRPQ
jgi:hypothetical protein